MTPLERWKANRGLAYGITREVMRRAPSLPEEDMEQEALLGLWVASLGYSEARYKFSAYAGSVIRRRVWNRALMHLPRGFRKSRGRRPAPSFADLSGAEVADRRPHEDLVDDREYVSWLIRKGVRNPEQRLVARLLWREGFSLGEVAGALDANYATVSWRAQEAFKSMRQAAGAAV